MKTSLIDVCHTIHHGMITYKGLPAPVITDHLSRLESHSRYEAGTEFHIGKIEMVANTGTYVDAPFHRYEAGKDLSELELRSVANLEGLVVRCVDRSGRAIGRDAFEGLDLTGKAVILHTGWDRNWGTEKYWEGTHPFLDTQAAEYLADSSVALVGIDSYNIDDTADGTRPAHSILLAHGIPIVEHLRGLIELPDSGFRFFAVPVKVRNLGTFPVRAFAIVNTE
ncbi:MAG TPA: cyclase family protein [Pyrinomonadaceae bacterium]|nr:cyclase family protein [Pyrinomonadaceae bacterium]